MNRHLKWEYNVQIMNKRKKNINAFWKWVTLCPICRGKKRRHISVQNTFKYSSKLAFNLMLIVPGRIIEIFFWLLEVENWYHCLKNDWSSLFHLICVACNTRKHLLFFYMSVLLDFYFTFSHAITTWLIDENCFKKNQTKLRKTAATAIVQMMPWTFVNETMESNKAILLNVLWNQNSSDLQN